MANVAAGATKRAGRACAARRRAAGLAIFLASLAGHLPAFAESFSESCAATRPEARLIAELPFTGDLGKPKVARSISGMACATPPGAAVRDCIMVGDESDAVWRVTLSKQGIVLRDTIRLMRTGKGSELDLEAAAFLPGSDGGAYYLTGSHGARRDDASYDAGRNTVFRLPAEQGSGAPRAEALLHTGNLATVLDTTASLVRFNCGPDRACVPLDKDGLTIEGLAARDGALYFGLRAPAQNGEAHVVKVALDALFTSARPRGEDLRLQLDAGDGIRDLAAVEGGFLVLAGLSRSDDGLSCRRTTIHFWDGRSPTTRPLAQIISTRAEKPEGLLVVQPSVGGAPYQVLVLSDGGLNGAPKVYEVPAP